MDRISRFEIMRDLVTTRAEREIEEVAAGRDAEKSLRSMIKDHITWKKAKIFHSKRVPNNYRRFKKTERFEIDLIVFSHKQISAIEVKNWSGSVRVSGSHWVQTRRNGEEIYHEDPLGKNKKKLECLCEFLDSKNVQIPKNQTSKVIFWNPKINIPQSIAILDEIVMRNELNEFLKHQRAVNFGEQILISVLELCLKQEESQIAADGLFSAIPTRDFNTGTQIISQLESFDRIELYGGRVICGDLRKLRTNGQSIDLKQLPQGESVRVECIRNKLLSFLSALFGTSPMIALSSPLQSIPVSSQDHVLFHMAGQKKPEEIKISRIVQLIRG